jgi:hypothetical protein
MRRTGLEAAMVNRHETGTVPDAPLIAEPVHMPTLEADPVISSLVSSVHAYKPGLSTREMESSGVIIHASGFQRCR